MGQFLVMKSDALRDLINLEIVSSFRSYERQEELFHEYFLECGNEALRFSALPGHSEHQTGLSFDINDASSGFIDTLECKWLNDNCYKYGFIIRYPFNKEDITGYKYEPWHIRYVGEYLSNILYNNGNWVTLEEYISD